MGGLSWGHRVELLVVLLFELLCLLKCSLFNAWKFITGRIHIVEAYGWHKMLHIVSCGWREAKRKNFLVTSTRVVAWNCVSFRSENVALEKERSHMLGTIKCVILWFKPSMTLRNVQENNFLHGSTSQRYVPLDKLFKSTAKSLWAHWLREGKLVCLSVSSSVTASSNANYN